MLANRFQSSTPPVALTGQLDFLPEQINDVQAARPPVLLAPVMPSPRPQMPRLVSAPILKSEPDRPHRDAVPDVPPVVRVVLGDINQRQPIRRVISDQPGRWLDKLGSSTAPHATPPTP